MSKLPVISRKHKVCIICEGLEEHIYFKRLISLNVWSLEYELFLVNAKGESNIFPRFQDAYNNDRFEVIIIFCDTDKAPYREYSQLKKKINDFFDKESAAKEVILWCNPCSMQVVLSHFGEVKLVNQGKKTNATVIEQMTGVSDYDGHEQQIIDICKKIFQRTYSEMKERLGEDDYDDTKSGTSNAVFFWELFESNDDEWISKINRCLE